MPQMETIYMFSVYLWTWSMLNLIMHTIKNTTITKTPKNPHHNTKNPALILPWT